MIWWHRLVLGHDTISQLRVPPIWHPGSPAGSYVLVECSCGRKWLR